MSWKVEHGADFVAALRKNAFRLIHLDRAEWLDLMERDLTELEALLAATPRAGEVKASRQGREVRRMRLRRTPFFAWYLVEPNRKVVTLVRLFHLRQRGPRLPE